jgi:hypothetical protein
LTNSDDRVPNWELSDVQNIELNDEDREYIRATLLLHKVELKSKRDKAQGAFDEAQRDVDYVDMLMARFRPTDVEAVNQE